ncbi:hypothetical protein IIB79_08160 [candidate division KSB1 bacterium]|nr:hypothetical protein [candidate division KSB1 bacterium]
MPIQMQKNAETVKRLIRREAYSNLSKILKKTHPADIAYFYRFFTPQERAKLFSLLQEDIDKTAEVLANMEFIDVAQLLETIQPEKITKILQKMPENRLKLALNHILGGAPCLVPKIDVARAIKELFEDKQ